MENIEDNIINHQSQVNILRNHLNKEINLIKVYTARNGFPKRRANSIIKRVFQNKDSNTNRSETAIEDSIKIFFHLNYSSETAERMVQ